MNGWKEGSPKYKQIQEVFIEVWRNIQDACDDNVDGTVSAEEWVRQKLPYF